MIEQALSLLERSDELTAKGDLAGAERLCQEALEIFEKEEGPESPDVANLLYAVGSIQEQRGLYDEAGASAARAVRIIEPLAPQFDGDDGRIILANALGLQGTALRQQGRYAEAEVPLKAAAAVAEQIGGTEALVTALNNLGVLYKFWGRFDEGERVYTRALEALKARGERGEVLATLLHNIGGLNHARGAYAAGEAPAREAWEIRRALLGDDDPRTLADQVAYAALLDGLGKYAESRPIYENAVLAYECIFGPEHYEVASTLHNLAALEASEGNGARAEELYRRALAIKTKLLGADHPDTALTAGNLSGILEERGQRVEALKMAKHALRVMEQTLAEGHPNLVAMRQHCAGLE